MGNQWIEITTKIGCSVQCEYCPQSVLVNRYHKKYSMKQYDIYMSFDTFKKCLSTIPTDIQIHFTGFCEPFLNPVTIDMIEYATHNKYWVVINTTLKGMTKEHVDRIKALSLALNIHLPDDKYKTNIIDNDYYEILEYAVKNAKTNFHSHGKVIQEVDEFIDKIKPSFFVRPIGIVSRAGNYIGKDTSSFNKRNNCPRIYSNVILPNGDVALCCSDYGLEEIIGNLKSMTFEELHSTEKFREIEKNGSLICKRCEI